jgi:hypothetical protein
MTTPIPQIILAVEGKMDFARMTNPFGAKKKQTEEQKAELNKQRSAFQLMKLDAKHQAKK